MNPDDIKESRELVIFMAKAVASVLEKGKDGKVSAFDIVSICTGLLPSAVAAFSGVGKVAGELKAIATCDASVLEILYADVMRELKWEPNDMRFQLLSKIWILVHHLVDTIQVCGHLLHPPKALEIPE